MAVNYVFIYATTTTLVVNCRWVAVYDFRRIM